MNNATVTAVACANIAFIKYWGNRDPDLRIPANGSISMNLDGLYTQTQVSFDPALTSDHLVINDRPATDPAQQRVRKLLNRVRQMSRKHEFAWIISQNNFPTGAGIASSASAFAALSLAATTAAGLDLSQRGLSRLARTGSGSACRSVPGGFVEWRAGDSDETSYAYSLASPEHWDLMDCIAIVSPAHKPVGSTEGHNLAGSSPLQAARVNDARRRLEWCRRAILERDFESFAEVVELDSNLMHAVMMTSTPPLIYWEPVTLAVIHSVQAWRRNGLAVCYTIDAGPNVHVLCPGATAHQVIAQLNQIQGVKNVLSASPGPPAHLIESNS
ncbi:MAG TPA: diphosphomevalonate decarboxylase [Anaerolineales bacterium]|jgi:diphosphomevalonate decarboxylase|nr:diphosphomevalonate decarboxylase [Anaerolineales bacterium]